LWGHIKRAEEGAMAELEATLLDREAFKVSLMAEVAHQYLQLRGTQSQLQIVQHNKAIAAHKLKLVGNQANNGFATRYDMSMAEAQLATVEAQMNSIAILLGESPHALDALLIMPCPNLRYLIPFPLAYPVS